MATRRAFVSRAAAVTAAGAGAALRPGGARAAGSAYAPARWRGAPLLPPTGRHLVSRFSYGITPPLAAAVRRAGGARKWFDVQLSPASVPDAPGDALDTWWPSLHLEADELWRRQITEVEGGWEVMADLARWTLLHRIRSARQVHEVMTEFWSHHLNVPANGDAQFTYRADYDRVVRAHALGRFEDLLHAAVTHPAMGIYLDNAVSTARHPNENLGRELLELHTVGRGSYTEDDVKSSARILTGWTVDLWDTWDATYSTQDHWRGPVSVLGFADANVLADGRDLTRRYLSYLARHPRTAERIARKLVVRFVRDDPPAALVDRLAAVYLDHDTEIKPVLRALVDSDQFNSPSAHGGKVRDPGEDIAATYRALGVRIEAPRLPYPDHGEATAAQAIHWQVGGLGLTPLSWPRPDGQPIDNEAWSSPARLVASMEVHYVMSGGWWPTAGITYRTPQEWMPQRRLRFDQLVDHLSQQILHRRSTARLLEACCQAVDVRPREVITRDHELMRWRFGRLLSTFLDSPTFLTR